MRGGSVNALNMLRSVIIRFSDTKHGLLTKRVGILNSSVSAIHHQSVVYDCWTVANQLLVNFAQICLSI